jgi:hypothetical protein
MYQYSNGFLVWLFFFLFGMTAFSYGSGPLFSTFFSVETSCTS